MATIPTPTTQLPSRAPVIVIAPDSFKGSLCAADVARAIATGIRRTLPHAELRLRPMADGGEGTLDAIVAGGEDSSRGAIGDASRMVMLRVRGASGAPVDARAAILADGTGIVEVAQVVGLTDPIGTATDVAKRDTRGVGEMIVKLLDSGCRRLMVGLGGSSTNDGGAGLLAALGVRFVDAEGSLLAPDPEHLAGLRAMDITRLDARLAACTVTVMSDVNNPLTGARGATAIFGPQKGVRAEAVDALDATLAQYAAVACVAFQRDVRDAPGAGAAGGLGYALQLLGATLRSGAEVVADVVGLDAALSGAAWAITGEGRSDAQTTMRKAPWIVAERARARAIPVSLLSGGLDSAALPALNRQFAGCFALAPGPASLPDAIAHASAWLADRADALTRLRFG